jgi:hypothetical protein
MFTPQSSYSIQGKVAGVDIAINICCNAEGADASKILNHTRGRKRPQMADPHNIQAMLVMAINEVLGHLQLEEEMPAALTAAEPKPRPVAVEKPPTAKVLDYRQYQKSKDDAEKGEGD